MKQSFEDFLAGRNADTDTVLQAARYYLAERTGDISPEEMQRQLVKAAGDANGVSSVLRTLERDTPAVESAALALLSCAWEEPGQSRLIQSAIDDAKTKLPVVEAAIVAIVAMYGMYLVITGGVKKSEVVIQRNPDETLEVRKSIEYFGATGPLSAVLHLFVPGKGDE